MEICFLGPESKLTNIDNRSIPYLYENYWKKKEKKNQYINSDFYSSPDDSALPYEDNFVAKRPFINNV